MASNHSKSKFYLYEKNTDTAATCFNGNCQSISKYDDNCEHSKSICDDTDNGDKSKLKYTYSESLLMSKDDNCNDQRNSKGAQVAVGRGTRVSCDVRLEQFAEIHQHPLEKESHENIVGAVFLGNDHILMAVFNEGSSKLRLMDIEGTIIDDVSTSPGLWGLTRIEADSAIALLDGCISYYELSQSKKLTFKLRFNIPEISKDGFSICKGDDDSTFAIGCEKKILKFDFYKKKVIKTIHLNKRSLIAMCVDDGKYIFCDRYSYSVICIDETGKELFIFKHDDLKFPRSICTDFGGNIYVTGELSNNVFRLKVDGNSYRVILSKRDGLFKPRVVSHDINHALLLVDNMSCLKLYHSLNML